MMTFLECSWLDKHGSDQAVFLSAVYQGNRTYTVDGNDITTLKKVCSGHFKDFKLLNMVCWYLSYTTVHPGSQIGN